MAERVPDINGATVVLVGSFNPTIFQPEWFLRQNLLGQNEAENATVKVLVPQICDFETERIRVQVTTDRFVAISKPAATPAPLRDLVLGTFFVLEHTPVTAMGLNRQMHFGLGSEVLWHGVGDKLVPKDGWKTVMPGRPGMRSLTIESLMTDDVTGPRLTIKVEPSQQVKFGVYFESNEHYPGPKADSTKHLMGVLKERWEGAYNHAAEIANRILDWARE